ncbi:hypothetical protein KC19_7G045700 [Ceratodon purpureus]|uniref:Mediator of RNA polymerase II transcription subunit 16 n=1 Tax=Ceratodon purpureus TaxID=3225 RepID=A0A8T0H745_CERPU|nr:hypothetical protein KC19_7G045700 [Ceratodon purpureus]
MQSMEGIEGDPAQQWSSGGYGNHKSEEELQDEEQDDKTILQVALRPPPYSSALKINFPDLCRKFSAVAWCSKTNLIACAVETCSRDQGSTQEPAFWIPIHLVDPERPTEHSIFNVLADSPGDSIQHLEWSPNSCPRALLIVNAAGRASIWSQPTQGGANVARTCNGWSCEYEWRQEQSISTKWLEAPPPYRWTSSPTPGKGSFEEKYLPHQARSTTRWPNFLCVCSVFWAGTVQLHWKQWPASSTKWFATKKGVLGAGASGVFTGDAIINDSGSLLVAAAPVGNPSTVVVWEVTAWDLNTPGNTQQVSAKIAMGNIGSPLLATSPSWPGFSPLAAYLFQWQEQSTPETLVEGEDSPGPVLHCSVVSNFSAYVSPDAAQTTSWGSGVTSVAFDPSRGGSALVTTVVEGYYISPGNPDAGPALTGWRIMRWESGTKPVNIHPLLENTSGPPPTMTTWTSVAKQNITRGRFSKNSHFNQKQPDYERPVNPRSVAKVVFAAHGGELAVALFSGEVHVFSGPSMTPVDLFHVKVNPHLPTPAFSPTSCCLASVWYDKKADVCTLRIAQVSPAPLSPNVPLVLERHLADRFWWSLVSEVDWWDVVATTQAAAEDGHVTVAKVMSVLDTDFHALQPQHRHHYGPALDRIKCRVLEGVEAADVRVLVLDMQGRLMLDMLGRGIEAALMNPSTLIAEPWQASSETLTGLGVDAMAVDPALIPIIQAYVDAVLDLASHFLTRLRRYASFCRTLTAHAASGTTSATTAARSAITPSTTPTSAAPASQGGVAAGTPSAGGTPQVQAGVQAWVQGAIAKINSSSANTDSPTSAVTSTTPAANLPLSVSTATFPGTPAVRLISDCHFLHRLCQLLLFCLIFRKRQLPLHVKSFSAGRPAAAGESKLGNIKEEPLMGQRTLSSAPVKVEEGGHSVTRTASTISKGAEDVANPRAQRVGNGNCGQGYTSDEVKYLFLVLVDLCKRTAPLPHPLPKSQLQSVNPILRLHFIDGQFTVAPEVVEASLGPHMQNLPRPRGADAAGLLMRELELHPPAEDWNRRMLAGGPGSAFLGSEYDEADNIDPSPIELWPRKRRRVEHDAAFGLHTAVGLGSFSTLLGSRRDVITSQWKAPSHGVWHKCLRCGRQTSALSVPSKTATPQTPPQTSTQLVKEMWNGRWPHGCPMCGGRWSRIV